MMNDFDKTFKTFAAIALVWGALVIAFWAAVVGVGVYALFHYGVL
jgi:hypothetical protein